MRYAKITAGMEAPPPSNEPIVTGDRQLDEFVGQWGLDGQCQKLLLCIDAETQQRLIKAFAPPAGTVSISRLFMTFAKNHVASMAQGRIPGGGSGGGVGGDGVTNPTGDTLLDEFLTAWGLGDDAQAMMLNLDHDTRQKVINGFAPPENTRNVSALFSAFLRSIPSASGMLGASNRFSPYPRVVPSSLGKGHDTAAMSVLGSLSASGVYGALSY